MSGAPGLCGPGRPVAPLAGDVETMLRVLSAWMLSCCLLLALVASGAAAGRTIKVYNW